MKMIFYAILLILLQALDATIVSLNETEYARLPPVIKMDPYEPCIHQPDGLYCDIELALVSDTPSQLLTIMQEYSALNATHYNHTKMRYSICVTKTCSEFYRNTTAGLKPTLEACLNYTLWQTYQLKARVSDGYSCNVHQKQLDIGAGDIIVALICLTILVANLVGSLWDIFFPTEVKSKVHRLLQCFSIARNWRKLTDPASTTPHLKQFQCLHGVRVMSTFCVIAAHSLLPYFTLSENTRFIEELYHTTFMKILSHGTLVMQIFLMMSAMLMIYYAQIYAETHSISLATIPKFIFSRWLRLTPTYAIVLGLTATWLRYVSTGPRWQFAVGDEAQACRQHWWQHILYINNYFDNSQCMAQTWYLAVDVQLYCLGVLVYVICRSTIMKKVVLPLLLIGGIAGPALHTYFQDLDAVVMISPENIIKIFKDYPAFDNVYKRGHTNLAGYVIGLAMGYLIYHWQKTSFDAKKYKNYRLVCWAAFPLVVCITYSGSVFHDRPRDPPALRAAYAGLSRTIFSVLIGTVLIGAIMRVEGVYRGVVSWRGWAVPSRLCYCAYLCHVPYIRHSAAALTATTHASLARFIESILLALVVSFAAGLVLALLVEVPLTNLIKLLRGGTPEPTNTEPEPEKQRCQCPIAESHKSLLKKKRI